MTDDSSSFGDLPAAAGRPGAWRRVDALLERLRPRRVVLSLGIDAAVVALAWQVTYVFRLGFDRWLSARPGYDGWVLLGIVSLYVLALAAFRVPRAVWRFVGFGEAQRLLLACLTAGAAAALIVTVLGLLQVPRAVLALHPWIALLGMILVRFGYRMLYEHARSRLVAGIAAEQGEAPRRAIVLGAGEAAKRLVAGIHRQGWTVLGLLDDDPGKRGARVAGLPVLGPLSSVREVAAARAATHLIVALPSLRGTRRLEVFDQAAQAALPVLTVPSAHQLEDGAQVARVRDIEPDDLLGREPVQLDERGVGAVLRGRTVLITGAGGSIGSELCRQVARVEPARLVLVELSEYNLYAIEQELGERHPSLPLMRLIGDVKDLAAMRAIMAACRPQVVFHAAAYKHVPLMEEPANLAPCLRNNVLGTLHAAQAAAEQGCERFVLISTDKAVNPTSVMGASKRAAEMVVAALAAAHPATRAMAVRFGNVLGSSGSVIPKFKEQIARGGPVTVTHPEVIRYFMTIPEAARLVLQAAAIGASGQVLVLDMGEPVKIVDLARRMIRLAGRSEAEIGIEISGLRPGEKLYEELLSDADATLPTPVERLRVARLAEQDRAAVQALVQALGDTTANDSAANDSAALMTLLRAAVPEYRAPDRTA